MQSDTIVTCFSNSTKTSQTIMINVDNVFARPDFTISIAGGSAEENSQMALAVMHSMRVCGFSSVQMDPALSAAPVAFNSADVLNSLRNLNPDLFETCFQINGIAEVPYTQPYPSTFFTGAANTMGVSPLF